MGKLETLYGELQSTHKPLMLNLIDTKYNGVSRAMEIIDYEKSNIPFNGGISTKRWRFRMADAAYLLNGDTTNQEIRLDNRGNVISIHHCKNKVGEAKFHWIWEIGSVRSEPRVTDEDTDPLLNGVKIAGNSNGNF